MANVKTQPRSNTYEQLLSANIPQFSAAEEAALIEKALYSKSSAEKRAAEDKLVKANLKFIKATAAKYQTRLLTQEDLFSAAVCGFLTALRTFDPSRGTCIRTHAIWAMKSAIMELINSQDSIVHIPVNVQREQRQLNKKLKQNAYAEFESFEDDEVEDCDESEKTLVLGNYGAISLDQSRFEDSRESRINCIADSTENGPEFGIVLKEQKSFISKALAVLNEKELYVVRAYDGFNGERLNFRDLEKEMGMTHEGIRVIYKRACGKIKKFADEMGVNFSDIAA